MNKTQKDIDEAWKMVDAYEKKLHIKEKELDELIEKYRKKALSQHDVSGRIEQLKCDGCFKPIQEETCYCEDCYIKHGELQ